MLRSIKPVPKCWQVATKLNKRAQACMYKALLPPGRSAFLLALCPPERRQAAEAA